jgi:hypothetical protein
VHRSIARIQAARFDVRVDPLLILEHRQLAIHL